MSFVNVRVLRGPDDEGGWMDGSVQLGNFFSCR